MVSRKNILFLILLNGCFSITAQVGIGTDNPDASSILEISSSNKGILIPRVALQSETDENTISDPINSLLVYNTNTDNNLVSGFYYWSAEKEKWLLIKDIDNSSIGVWYKQNTNVPATANTENVFLGGTVVVGKDMSNDENEDITLEVAGAFRSGEFSTPELGIIGANSAAFGEKTVGGGRNSFAIGYLSEANGENNFSGGGTGEFSSEILEEELGVFLDSVGGANVSGQSNFGFGPGITIEGLGSMSVGFFNESSGIANFSLGGLNKTIDPDLGFNYAFGLGNEAQGGIAFAFGFFSEAKGSNTCAFGDGVKAIADGATAFGYQTIASGKTSVTFGDRTAAGGRYSAAFGTNTIASGEGASVFGRGTIAANYTETVIGKYNAITTATQDYPLFQIGNGTDNSNRTNALTVLDDGWIGIGVWQKDSTEKLNVDGSIKTATTTYPDYVFEDYFENQSTLNPSYKFKNLGEVKIFIEENRHLPGILPASALTRTNKGEYRFNLSELSVRSLEKIEELFLYIIEQESEINVLREKIKNLEERNEILLLQNSVNDHRIKRLETLILE